MESKLTSISRRRKLAPLTISELEGRRAMHLGRALRLEAHGRDDLAERAWCAANRVDRAFLKRLNSPVGSAVRSAYLDPAFLARYRSLLAAGRSQLARGQVEIGWRLVDHALRLSETAWTAALEEVTR